MGAGVNITSMWRNCRSSSQMEYRQNAATTPSTAISLTSPLPNRPTCHIPKPSKHKASATAAAIATTWLTSP